MKQINMKSLVAGIFTLTVVCIILGVMFNKTEAEKVNGLAETFDVSTDGIVAYVSYDEGKPGIYVRTDQKDELALELPEEENISDIAFSPNGIQIAYIVNNADNVSLHTMDARSFDTKELFQEEAYLTEIAYDPENAEQIFYLRADTFENYSPIAQAKPHEFDVYSYDTSEQKETKHTDIKAYDMSSLSIADDAEDVYVTMVDDTKVQTEGENFSVGQRIFRIPLEEPDKKQPVDTPPGEDIYDIAILPDEEDIIYQAVNRTGEDGIYQYELFHYNIAAEETEQLTNVHSHASHPVLDGNNQTVYFIVNENFAGEHADNRLYKINIDETGESHIPLEYE